MNSDSLQKLEDFGYSETEARFIELVALHSGLFLRRHYIAYAGVKTGKHPTEFLKELLSKKHAKFYNLAKNAKVYHLTSRQIYDALNQPNIRHRRKHSIDYVKTKLLTMDFVLENPSLNYLPTEEEKLNLFCDQLSISRVDLPQKVYKSPHSKKATTRYFVEKYPITYWPQEGNKPKVTFHYIDPGAYRGISDFITYLRQYRRLFAHFNPLELVYIHQKTSKLIEAERLFSAFDTGLATDFEELSRYFSLREKWEAGRFEALSQADLKFFTLAKKRFAGPGFDRQFSMWKEGRLILQTPAKIQARERRFTPFKLRGSYGFFGDLD
jgi:hypothetical protein